MARGEGGAAHGCGLRADPVATGRDSGGVDKAVELAKCFIDLGDDVLDVVDNGEVGLDVERLGTLRLDGRRHRRAERLLRAQVARAVSQHKAGAQSSGAAGRERGVGATTGGADRTPGGRTQSRPRRLRRRTPARWPRRSLVSSPAQRRRVSAGRCAALNDITHGHQDDLALQPLRAARGDGHGHSALWRGSDLGHDVPVTSCGTLLVGAAASVRAARVRRQRENEL